MAAAAGGEQECQNKATGLKLYLDTRFPTWKDNAKTYAIPYSYMPTNRKT